MPGKVLASYLVRVTLHEREDPAAPAETPEAPTLEEVTELVKDVLYNDLAYFTYESIGVSAERTDQ
jgi:hypothetical protein